MVERIPRIAVAAIQGRSGKTTFTIGLLKALRDRGLKVQPFKKGPDFIDPSWAAYASGITSRNLDAFMMHDDEILHTFCQGSRGKDLSVIEGAMGIFDGLDVDGSNSTAEMAYLLKTPVVLVVSGQRITRSVAALINGVKSFDPRITICGVVLNQVARPRHLNIMTQSIEKYCDVPILGALPKSKDIEIPDRHLGLIPAGEQEALQQRIERLGNMVSDHVNLDLLLELASATPALEDPIEAAKPIEIADRPRIGVFRDKAFSFYYPENLEALEKAGADLVFINGMTDAHLPDVQGLYIGGGFPEVMAKELTDNKSLRGEVRDFCQAGYPVYAECGGLMYLTQGIETEGDYYEMAGVFSGKVHMERKSQGHGYTIQSVLPGNPFFAEGTEIRGHEFHHSRLIDGPVLSKESFGFRTLRGHGITQIDKFLYDGLVYKNTFACYHHLHATGTRDWANRFVSLARENRRGIK